LSGNLMSMLAIASPHFNAPSTTFIRNHVCTLAPGQTILLCEDGSGTEQFGCPVLFNINSDDPRRNFGERAVASFRRRWRTYVDPSLKTSDRRRVKAFFTAHKTRVLLAEFGLMGCLLARTAREAGLPLYVHFHGYDGSQLLRDRRQVRWYRSLFRHAD